MFIIYLDSASTTRPAAQVVKAMLPYLGEEFGNPGSLYGLGRKAKAALWGARQNVAALLNCPPEHLIFTSGGTESNNMVFECIRSSLIKSGKRHLVVSATEHNSVLKAAGRMLEEGFFVSYAMPERDGSIPTNEIKRLLRSDTGLISVMYVNNETGAVNDIESIGTLCRENKILFHSDCVQAAGNFEIDVNRFFLDFASVSSHKIYGPKGAGALYIRDLDINPLIYGGSNQEFGLRGGTQNVPGIVGFGEAAGLAKNIKNFVIPKYLFFYFLQDELSRFGFLASSVRVNGPGVSSPGKILNLLIEGVDSETLLLMLDSRSIYISAGSACNSYSQKPSHALLAMGLSPEEARSSVRVSFCEHTTINEIINAAKETAHCIKVLRSAGGWNV